MEAAWTAYQSRIYDQALDEKGESQARPPAEETAEPALKNSARARSAISSTMFSAPVRVVRKRGGSVRKRTPISGCFAVGWCVCGHSLVITTCTPISDRCCYLYARLLLAQAREVTDYLDLLPSIRIGFNQASARRQQTQSEP